MATPTVPPPMPPAVEEEDVEEMKRTVAPEAVLDAIEESERIAEEKSDA